MPDPETTLVTDSISQKEDKQSFKTVASQSQPGHLYIVATPIGNLRDITLRALDILGSVDEILAEDTRRSRKILNAYDIKTPLTAYHDHNVAKKLPPIIKALEAGRSLALISDAGTPLVSDPGFKLVRAAVRAGLTVVPLPGASAVLAALVTAGLPSNSFTFCGFLPPKSPGRKRQLESLKTLASTLIFFETGPRVLASLKDMQEVLGDRSATLSRELTKTYEETRRGTISEIIKTVRKDPPRGEIVLCIAPAPIPEKWPSEQIDAALKEHVAEMGLKRASAHIATLSDWTKRDVYQRALRLRSEDD